jgi:large subunit ribosomal protein L29
VANAADLRELADEALLEQLNSAKEELFNLRFQLATGQLDNPTRLKTVRHDVARILTVLRERELEEPSAIPEERGAAAAPEEDER